MNQVVRQQKDAELQRSSREPIRRYVQKIGLSRAQTTRLIRQYLAGEEVKPRTYQRHGEKVPGLPGSSRLFPPRQVRNS